MGYESVSSNNISCLKKGKKKELFTSLEELFKHEVWITTENNMLT